MPGLGPGELSVNDRAAHMDAWPIRVEVDVHHTQRDRLGDPQTGRRQQLKERLPVVGDLAEQPRHLLAREKASLIELVGAPPAPTRQQHHRLPTIAEQAGACGVRQARLQRHHDVPNGAVAEAVTVVIGQATQPVDECPGAVLVELAQPLVGLEVRQRVADQ